MTCGFAFKFAHHSVVDVKCGLHTEAHIIDMDIWLGPNMHGALGYRPIEAGRKILEHHDTRAGIEERVNHCNKGGGRRGGV